MSLKRKLVHALVAQSRQHAKMLIGLNSTGLKPEYCHGCTRSLRANEIRREAFSKGDEFKYTEMADKSGTLWDHQFCLYSGWSSLKVKMRWMNHVNQTPPAVGEIWSQRPVDEGGGMDATYSRVQDYKGGSRNSKLIKGFSPSLPYRI